MESMRNYLLSKRQSQKAQFERAHGACELQELSPGQEVLFRSPGQDEYIPRTIVNRTTVQHSYIMEAQGKCYCRTREHLRPIHINLPSPKTHQPQPPNPKPLPSCISKPCFHSKHTFQPKTSTPAHIPHPPVAFHGLKQPSKPNPSSNAAPSVEDLLWHLSSVNPSLSIITTPQQLELPSVPTPPATLEEIAIESPHHSVTHQWSLTVNQVLPAAHAPQYPVHHTPCSQGYP